MTQNTNNISTLGEHVVSYITMVNWYEIGYVPIIPTTGPGKQINIKLSNTVSILLTIKTA
jgi:hypothetical protein